MYLTTSLNSVLFDKMYSMQVSNANVSRPSHSATEGWAGAKPCGGAHCLMEPEDGDKESKKDSPKLGPSPFSLRSIWIDNNQLCHRLFSNRQPQHEHNETRRPDHSLKRPRRARTPLRV